jgi:hypothetical protein
VGCPSSQQWSRLSHELDRRQVRDWAGHVGALPGDSRCLEWHALAEGPGTHVGTGSPTEPGIFPFSGAAKGLAAPGHPVPARDAGRRAEGSALAIHVQAGESRKWCFSSLLSACLTSLCGEFYSHSTFCPFFIIIRISVWDKGKRRSVGRERTEEARTSAFGTEVQNSTLPPGLLKRPAASSSLCRQTSHETIARNK